MRHMFSLLMLVISAFVLGARVEQGHYWHALFSAVLIVVWVYIINREDKK